MLIHNVFFWLKPETTAGEIADFEAGLASLLADSGVRAGYYGPPGATAPRPVVETTYSYGLVLIFDDAAAEARYQDAPVHVKFLQDHKPKFEKVVVYDVQGA